MEDFNPTPTPPQPSSRKKWLLLTAGILILVGAASLPTIGSLFKGALFIDQNLQNRKILSDASTLAKDAVKIDQQHTKECDVIVAGAGTGGITAAIASAREGAKTCLIEETDWLGGMLTAAGVSAIDGRPDSISGIFYEFTQKLEKYYAPNTNVIHNCTVSYLCFEPNVGDKILKEMVGQEKNLEVFYNSKINKVYREGNNILGVNFIQNGTSYIANANVTIDATEYGDLMYLGNIPYSIGIDKDSKESLADRADSCIQPLTYVAILRKTSTPSTIEMPPNYDREKYKCLIKGDKCPDSNSKFDFDRLMSYGRMPNNKLMINIPSHSYGNDFHANSENLENYSREAILEEAKNYSRGFIYFLQTEVGLENYALDGEFNTSDNFAKMPYVRESRRLVGEKRLVESDVVKGGGIERADIYDDAIAIGDYPIDLHFCKYGKGDIFQPIAPYQIPYGVTIPKEIDGFMAADKNISVSHIVNGTTRLQPVTMSVGQAVGIAAAMASKQGIEPRDIDVHVLQQKLLAAGSNLFFFKDLPTQHWAYKPVAQLAIKGLLSGYSDFTFRPSDPVTEGVITKIFEKFLTLKNQDKSILASLNLNNDSANPVNREETAHYLYQLLEATNALPINNDTSLHFTDIQEGTTVNRDAQALAALNIVSRTNTVFRPNDKLTRAEAIVLIGRTMDAIFTE